MKNHPSNRDRQIDAVRRAGFDPQIGTWPGDPGYDKPLHSTRRDFADTAGEHESSQPSKSLNPIVRSCAKEITDLANSLNTVLAEAARRGIVVHVMVKTENRPDATARTRSLFITMEKIA